MQTYTLAITFQRADGSVRGESHDGLLEGDVENVWQAARRLAGLGETVLRHVTEER